MTQESKLLESQASWGLTAIWGSHNSLRVYNCREISYFVCANLWPVYRWNALACWLNSDHYMLNIHTGR
jgi:hypothetical protein